MKKILCALLGLILTLPGFAACPSGQIEQTYTSATGTVVQNGTPTPTNPIEPVFYQQGDMTLRAVGYGDNIVADTYDATTGKITRNVNSYTFTGNESFTTSTAYGEALIITAFDSAKGANRNVAPVCNYFLGQPTTNGMQQENTCFFNGSGHFYFRTTLSAADFKTWLAARYAEGNPVIAYFARSTSTTTDWTETAYCQSSIKIATTAYNSARFSPVVTELNDTIATIRDVVTNTINQTKAIADLQATKQTRPDETCPAGKKCLLVEDDAGQPHWYEIIENAYGLPSGYTALEYIQSTGTQYIDTGFSPDANTRVDYKGQLLQYSTTVPLFGARVSTDKPGRFFPLAFSTNSGLGRFTYGNFETVFTISTSTIYTGSFIPAQQKTIINGLTYDIVAADASFTKTANNNFYLFATSGYENILYNSVGRIWYVKIYDNGTLVRDMIPAKNSSGVIGMYDLANDVFYTNAGTGTFVEGPVVQ